MATYTKNGLKRAQRVANKKAQSVLLKSINSSTRIQSVMELAKIFVEHNYNTNFTDIQYRQIIRQLNSYLKQDTLAEEVVMTASIMLKEHHTNFKNEQTNESE